MYRISSNIKNFLDLLEPFNGDSLRYKLINESWKYVSEKHTAGKTFSQQIFTSRLVGFGHNLYMLSFFYCSRLSLQLVTDSDLEYLLKAFEDIEHHTLFEKMYDEDILDSIKNSPYFKEHSDITDFLTPYNGRFFNIAHYATRSIVSKMGVSSIGTETIERNYRIFKYFYKKLDISSQKKIAIYFGMPPEQVNAALSLLLYFFADNAENGKPGAIYISSRVHGIVMDGVKSDEMILIARRLSWVDEVLAEESARMLCPENIETNILLSPFLQKPFIHLKVPDADFFQAPFPWFISFKWAYLFNDCIRDAFDKETSEKLRSLWSQSSYKLFIKDFKHKIKADFIELDYIEKAKITRFADLIIYQEGHALIIEFKNALGNLSDKLKRTTEGAAKIFLLQLSALKQCIDTQKNIKRYLGEKEIKTIASAVVTFHDEIFESDIISTFDAQTDYFKKQGFNNFDVMDISDLEHLLNSHSIEKINSLINEVTLERRKGEGFAEKSYRTEVYENPTYNFSDSDFFHNKTKRMK